MADGPVLTEQMYMQEYVDNFYSRFYNQEQEGRAQEEARADCFISVPRVVTQEQNDTLNAPPEMAEIHAAIKEIVNGKAPTWTVFLSNSSRRYYLKLNKTFKS